MTIVIGLGNPGKKYKNTRHNLGFLIIDHLIKAYKLFPHLKPKLRSEISLLQLNKEEQTIFAKPLVFMNNSGEAVKRLVGYFKVPRSCIWVVHDDSQLPLGGIKISRLKGAGGHKGVKSIVENLKSERFVRFRIGTGWQTREKNQEILEKWVLKPFSKREKAIIDKIIPKVSEAIMLALKEGLAAAENKFNKKN